jgi:endogenous inhibitor of DNA gyrase (YacG/DUF329 family)
MSARATRNLCPLCGATSSPRHTPFCGQGCRDRDLLQWLGDGYRIPGPAIEVDEETGLDTSEPRD